MAICEAGLVDRTHIDKKGISLIIQDDLDWKDENSHLKALQNKLNTYIGLIQRRQLEPNCSEDHIAYYLIEIRFRHKLTRKCFDFMLYASQRLAVCDIKLVMKIG